MPRNWLVIGLYLGGISGWAVSHYGIDKKVIEGLRERQERMLRRNTRIILDESQQLPVQILTPGTVRAAQS
jgi:hypothetical protein